MDFKTFYERYNFGEYEAVKKKFEENLKKTLKAKECEEMRTSIASVIEESTKKIEKFLKNLQQNPHPEKNMQVKFNQNFTGWDMTLETTDAEIIKIFKEALKKGGIDAVSKMLKAKGKFKIEKPGFYKAADGRICYVYHIDYDEHDDDCCAVSFNYKDEDEECQIDKCTRYGKETEFESDIVECIKECDIYDESFLEMLK